MALPQRGWRRRSSRTAHSCSWVQLGRRQRAGRLRAVLEARGPAIIAGVASDRPWGGSSRSGGRCRLTWPPWAACHSSIARRARAWRLGSPGAWSSRRASDGGAELTSWPTPAWRCRERRVDCDIGSLRCCCSEHHQPRGSLPLPHDLSDAVGPRLPGVTEVSGLLQRLFKRPPDPARPLHPETPVALGRGLTGTPGAAGAGARNARAWVATKERPGMCVERQSLDCSVSGGHGDPELGPRQASGCDPGALGYPAVAAVAKAV